MDIKNIRKIIQLVNDSNLTEFNYENSEEKLNLKKEKNVVVTETINNNNSNQEGTMPITKTETAENSDSKEIVKKEKDEITNDDNLTEITSPIVGTFYSAPSPDSEPYVKAGDKIKRDDVLCIIEAMKLMNEITAEFDCEIVKILVENEEMVEYGKPLFLVKPI